MRDNWRFKRLNLPDIIGYMHQYVEMMTPAKCRGVAR